MGLDVARGLAIIGMIIVHMSSLLWSTKVVINGVPSALFAVATVAATVRYAPYTLPQIYPLLAWIAYFIGGMLLYDVHLKSFVTGSKQRAFLTWAVTNVSLVVVAIGMCFRFQMNVPGWLRSTGHTGALGEILLSVAASAVIFHPCLIVGEKAPKVVYLVAAMGSMSLTVYILHVLTAYWWQQNIALHSTLSALGFVVFFLVIAALWKHFLGEGPMERLVARNIDLAVPAGKKA